MTMLLRVTLSASLSLLLLLSSLTSSTEARDRGHRSSRLGSIWDVILPPKKSSLRARDDIQTNKINIEGNMKSAAREKQLNIEDTTTTTTTTQRPRPTVVTSEDGKRKILLSLMDVYHCPTRGVFPIDGDCERFLMCRRSGDSDRIKGKVYRCPKGYLFSSSGARCQPEDSVACHRSQPLASLLSHAMSRGDLFLLP